MDLTIFDSIFIFYFLCKVKSVNAKNLKPLIEMYCCSSGMV